MKNRIDLNNQAISRLINQSFSNFSYFRFTIYSVN